MTSVQALEKKTPTVEAVIRVLLKTMAYLRNPENRRRWSVYRESFKIDPSVADKAFASMLTTYSVNGTKPRPAIEKEIEIYRETLQVAKAFRPEDLEDMRSTGRNFNRRNSRWSNDRPLILQVVFC